MGAQGTSGFLRTTRSPRSRSRGTVWPMPEPDLSEYVAMWTTQTDRWELRGRPDRLLPVAKGDPPMAQIIEDDEVAKIVIGKMLAAGVEVVDPHQMRTRSSGESR